MLCVYGLRIVFSSFIIISLRLQMQFQWQIILIIIRNLWNNSPKAHDICLLNYDIICRVFTTCIVRTLHNNKQRRLTFCLEGRRNVNAAELTPRPTGLSRGSI